MVAKAPALCGFCNDGKHSRCVHTLRNGNKGPWHCACAEPNCGDKVLVCLDCRSTEDEAEISPDTFTCLDPDGCQARITKKRNSNPEMKKLISSIKESNMAAAEKKTEKKAPAAKKVGYCLVTGKETKGGLFAPGMDARYVSNHVEAVLTKDQTKAQALKKMKEDGVSEALRAKFEKSLSIKQEKAAKAKEAEKEKASAKKESKPKGAAKKAAAAKAQPAPEPESDEDDLDDDDF